MKQIFIFLLFFSSIVVQLNSAFSFKSSQNNSDKYKMEISMDKYEYLEGEYISLNIKIKNTSSNFDSTEFLTDDDLYNSTTIKSEKGKINYTYPHSYTFNIASSFIKIPPIGKLNFSMRFGREWGFESFDTHEKTEFGWITGYFPEGKYEVDVNFKYDKGKKNIQSNKIYFTVKRPDGNDERAFERLKEIYKLPYGRRYGEITIQNTIMSWIEFMNIYKNSVYYENAFMESVYKRKFSNLKSDTTLYNDCMYIINKMPNSMTSRTAVNEALILIRKVNNDNKAIEFLEKIKEDYPETEAAKWSDELLMSEIFKK